MVTHCSARRPFYNRARRPNVERGDLFIERGDLLIQRPNIERVTYCLGDLLPR